MAKDIRPKPTGPLSGLKVIDLSHVMAGPTCTMLLADMGADVIKVEKIPGGDDAHRMMPPMIGDESAAFLIMNRNKRGIAVDLKTDAGRKALFASGIRRCAGRKLSAGNDGAHGAWLRNAARVESEADLLFDIRLWANRALRGSRRFRSGRAGHERIDEHHRRRARPSAHESRVAGYRYHCWYSWLRRNPGRVIFSSVHRERAVGGHFAF